MKNILLITALITIAFTAWASVPDFGYPLGGYSQADISNMFPSAVTPAGFTFAIWSLIYLSWILAGLSLSSLPLTHLAKKHFPRAVVYLTDSHTSKKTVIAFSSAILLTGVWLIPWGNLYIGTSLIVMLIILGLLKYVFTRTRSSTLLMRSSVDLTLGWINIATVANITIFLLSIGFTGWSIPDFYWAIGVLGFASLLTAYYQCKYHTYIISLVFLWTLFWEWVAHPILEQRWAVVIYAIVTIVLIITSYIRQK